MRLDTAALRDQASRQVYSEFPHPQSEAHWSTLLSAHGDSPLALAAAVRLSELALRQGDVADAVEHLERVLSRDWSPKEHNRRDTANLIEYFAPEPAESSLGFETEPLLIEARRVYELISNNAGDTKYGVKPLEDFFRLDPRRPGYAEQVRRIMERYPDADLQDNLAVRWAMTAASWEERLSRLDLLLRRFSTGDAAAEAMFRMADINLQARGQTDRAVRRRGIAEMQVVTERFAGTVWGQLARQRLALLDPSPAEPDSSE